MLETVRTVVRALFSFSVLIALPAWAQDPQAAPPPSSAFRLDSVSAHTAYFSSGLAPNSGQPLTSTLGSDLGMGASATIIWVHNDERSGFSLTYTADYSGQVRYSSLNAHNHLFSMTATRRLAPRWDLDFSMVTNVLTADRLALLPNELSGPALASPALLLYGDRMLSTSAQLGLSYNLSSRTSIAWRLGGTRYQSLMRDTSIVETSLVPPPSQSTTVVGGMQISHALSSRTQVGIGFDTSRAISGFLDTWYHRASLSLSRTLNQRWSLAVRGGGGYIQPSQKAGDSSASLQYIAGGSLGYHTLSHTFQASSDRTVGDSYGLGATSIVVNSVTWIWAPAGSLWSVRASAGQQQLDGGALGTIHTWQAASSIGRALSRHTFITAEYGYMRYSGAGLLGAITPSTVRLAMVWRPGLGLLR